MSFSTRPLVIGIFTESIKSCAAQDGEVVETTKISTPTTTGIENGISQSGISTDTILIIAVTLTVVACICCTGILMAYLIKKRNISRDVHQEIEHKVVNSSSVNNESNNSYGLVHKNINHNAPYLYISYRQM